jgi:AcrR family transcriptional regulator
MSKGRQVKKRISIPVWSDGRHKRSEASRRAIVDAMLALVRGGEVSPSAEAVAARAKVGLRSVFRHFANMESLYREMHARIAAEIMPLATQPFAAAAWREVLGEVVARRADIFERVLPIRIASDVQRHTSLFLETRAREMNAMQRHTLVETLPKALRDGATLEALDLVLSFDTWRRLRRDQGLSPARARAVLEEMVRKLVA